MSNILYVGGNRGMDVLFSVCRASERSFSKVEFELTGKRLGEEIENCGIVLNAAGAMINTSSVLLFQM